MRLPREPAGVQVAVVIKAPWSTFGLLRVLYHQNARMHPHGTTSYRAMVQLSCNCEVLGTRRMGAFMRQGTAMDRATQSASIVALL